MFTLKLAAIVAALTLFGPITARAEDAVAEKKVPTIDQKDQDSFSKLLQERAQKEAAIKEAQDRVEQLKAELEKSKSAAISKLTELQPKYGMAGCGIGPGGQNEAVWVWVCQSQQVSQSPIPQPTPPPVAAKPSK